METSSRVDQSLERASRVLELTNVEAIAQAERQRLDANLRARRTPGFLMSWHKGGDKLGVMGYWETIKCLLLIVMAMPSPYEITRLTPYQLTLCVCVAVALLTASMMAATRLSRGIAWRESVVMALLLPFKVAMPGFIFADLIVYQICKRRIVRLGLGEPLSDAECNNQLEVVRKQTPSELVRAHAVAEIDKIKAEIVGSDSMLAKVEDELSDGLDLAEAMRLQVLHRLTRAEGPRKAALEQGMELAKKRVANLRKALSKHRDVMARARAILDECRASAEGLGEVVEDSELLAKLEAGEIEDERKIALSELVMDQAVGQLRNRVMSLEGVLAQLEAPRCRVADAPQVEADDAYLGRIEHVAEQLAAI